jgi:threonine dehydrogenase-like Zn-dependent dehydrogenase
VCIGKLAVGDIVVVHGWMGCQSCGPCKAGDVLMCNDFMKHNIGVGKEGG